MPGWGGGGERAVTVGASGAVGTAGGGLSEGSCGTEVSAPGVGAADGTGVGGGVGG